MSAVASGLIEAIKLAILGRTAPYTDYANVVSGAILTGTNWDFIPTGAGCWFKFGSGGIEGWGTVCGVPNAIMTVLSMMNLNKGSYTVTHGDPPITETQLFVDEIMLHYEQTPFPSTNLYEEVYLATNYQSLFSDVIPQLDDDVKAQQAPGSPLCHISISKWAWAANVKYTDLATSGSGGGKALTHKIDRCARMAGDCAAHTAEMLNGAFGAINYEIPHDTEACLVCHNATGTSIIPVQEGHMDCGECHTELSPHSKAGVAGSPPSVGHVNWNVTNLTVSFGDNSTDSDQDQNTLTVMVNWGDGNAESGVGGATFTHTYASPGKYTIIHTVKDAGNQYASEMIEAAISATGAVAKASITVAVKQDGGSAVGGATVYLKRKKGSGDWKQVTYGYTDSAGSKTFTDLIVTDCLYKVVVYKSGFDFNGAVKGTQSKVRFEDVGQAAVTLTADTVTTITVQQGNAATNGPVGYEGKGDNGNPPSITIA